MVDLTEVKKGAADIAKIFGDQPDLSAINASQASKISEARTVDISGTSTKTSQAGTSINYTQNNYSPKALTRLEIHRNTRNQLQALKGVS